MEKIFRLLRSRRLAVTVRGHLGLVQIAAQKGDPVFFLVGCNVPVVLRVIEGNKYQIIGCCYLQGFMEGEAEDDWDRNTKEHDAVILC